MTARFERENGHSTASPSNYKSTELVREGEAAGLPPVSRGAASHRCAVQDGEVSSCEVGGPIRTAEYPGLHIARGRRRTGVRDQISSQSPLLAGRRSAGLRMPSWGRLWMRV